MGMKVVCLVLRYNIHENKLSTIRKFKYGGFMLCVRKYCLKCDDNFSTFIWENKIVDLIIKQLLF